MRRTATTANAGLSLTPDNLIFLTESKRVARILPSSFCVFWYNNWQSKDVSRSCFSRIIERRSSGVFNAFEVEFSGIARPFSDKRVAWGDCTAVPARFRNRTYNNHLKSLAWFVWLHCCCSLWLQLSSVWSERKSYRQFANSLNERLDDKETKAPFLNLAEVATSSLKHEDNTLLPLTKTAGKAVLKWQLSKDKSWNTLLLPENFFLNWTITVKQRNYFLSKHYETLYLFAQTSLRYSSPPVYICRYITFLSLYSSSFGLHVEYYCFAAGDVFSIFITRRNK